VSRSSPLWLSVPKVIFHYGVAVLAVAAAVGVGRVVDSFFQAAPFVSVFLCAILLAAWLGGPGPGLLATGLSILAFDYFFLSPVHSFLVASNEISRLSRLILFAITALFVVGVSAAQRRGGSSAEKKEIYHEEAHRCSCVVHRHRRPGVVDLCQRGHRVPVELRVWR
jgi:K+-sensing histidine kinase KdpD